MRGFSDYRIVPAEAGHIPGLAAAMREMDRRELRAGSGLEPAEALARSLAVSRLAFTALTTENFNSLNFDKADFESGPAGAGHVIQMWGVAPSGGLLGRVGTPWLLGSTLLERPDIAREFIRQSRPRARALEAGFRRLENWVHAENALAVRWLKWLGYQFGETFMVRGEPFRRFWKETGHV
jgi:hypothetical protein